MYLKKILLFALLILGFITQLPIEQKIIATTDNFDKYFETTHNLNADNLCAMYGFEYKSASNEDQLNGSLKDFYSLGEKPKLLEVFTPRTLNDEVLLNYFNYIR